jgi:hypothetical protein
MFDLRSFGSSEDRGISMNRLLLAGACAGAFLAAALAGQADARTLRWSFQGDIATLDPYAHTESFTANVLHHIYDPLVRRDKNLAIEPALAESWQVVEPTRWRFKLRAGVKFHNGNAFDADDVVASITRLLDPAARARGNLATVLRAEKVDALTVDFVLRGPYPLLLNDLTGIYIMDKEWLEANNATKPGNITTGVTTFASTNANGTGPFKLDSYVADSRMVMSVNPDWWDRKVEHNLTRIEFRPIRSDARRRAAFGRTRPDRSGAAAGPAAHLRGPRAQGDRGTVAARDLLRLQLARFAPGGAGPEEPAQGREGPAGAGACHRPRHDPAARDARQIAQCRRDGGAAGARLFRVARPALPVQPRPGEEAARRGRLPERLQDAAVLPQ